MPSLEPALCVLQLPEELVLCIIRNLSPLDKAAAQQACSKLRSLTQESTKFLMVDDALAHELLGDSSQVGRLASFCEMNPKALDWVVSVSSAATLKSLLLACATTLERSYGLDLSRANVGAGEILTMLPAVCRNVSRLAISLCEDDSSVAGCLASLSGLSELQLYDVGQVTDPQLACLSSLHQLEGIMLHYPVCLTDACFSHLATLKQLRSLRLVRSYGLEGTGLRELADLPQLTEVQLVTCKGVTEEGLKAITTLKHLKMLQLHVGDKYGNPLLLTQQLLQQLSTSLTALELLELNSRVQLSEPLSGRSFPSLTRLVFNEKFKFGYDDAQGDSSGWDIASTLQYLLPLPRLLSLSLGGWIHLATDTFHAVTRQSSLMLLSCSVLTPVEPTVFRPLAELRHLRALELHIGVFDVPEAQNGLPDASKCAESAGAGYKVLLACSEHGSKHRSEPSSS